VTEVSPDEPEHEGPHPFDAGAAAAALGGPLGIAESSLPPVAYVTAYTAGGQDTHLAIIVALALGVVLTVARIARGQTVQFALSGLAGVALAAFVVSRTGHAEDYFLPGILTNLGYTAAYFVSILVRWPLIGVIIGLATGGSMAWRRDENLVAAYRRASWIWVGLFGLRFAVQLPLYLSHAVVALGVAKVAMGLPLFALGIWLSYLVLRQAGAIKPSQPRGEATSSA
jgi:hypothetical protein